MFVPPLISILSVTYSLLSDVLPHVLLWIYMTALSGLRDRNYLKKTKLIDVKKNVKIEILNRPKDMTFRTTFTIIISTPVQSLSLENVAYAESL